MTPKYKNIPQTLCEFHSFSPSVGEGKPKCSTKHPGSGLNYSTMHFNKVLPVLVPLEAIYGYLQFMKLSGKEPFKGVTCLRHDQLKLLFDEP